MGAEARTFRDDSPPPLNTDSLAEQTFQLLLHWIVTLRLKSGERIRISQLQEYLGISGAPIRDALHRLAQARLVEVRARVGYFVRKLSPSEIREIWNSRELFEVYALNTAFDALPRDQISELRADSLLQLAIDPFDSNATARLEHIDGTFHHSLLIGNCGNSYVIGFYNSVFNLILLTRHLHERYREDIHEHLEIFDAILRGDRKNATLALKGHLRAVERDLLDNYS